MIHIQNISKSYAGKNALKDVSAKFVKGIVYALVGKNGSGKTTLIDSMLGLVTLDNGSIESDYVVSKDIAYMTSDKIYSGNTKLKSIINYTKAISSNFNFNLFNEMISPFNIDVNKTVGQLSRGEIVAFSFCVCLARETEVIIMDEPFSGIDIITRDIMVDVLFSKIDLITKCLIMSSHELQFIEKYVDEILLMKDGIVKSNKNMSDSGGLTVEEWFKDEH